MIAEVSQRSAAPPLDEGYARRHRLCSTAARFSFLNSFVAFPWLSCVARPRTTHDLRRASTRTDPNPYRGARIGRGHAALGARRRTRPGGGGRLRVRLDGAGRHGGGGDRGPHRLGRPALLASPATSAHTHPHADPHTHPDPDAAPSSATTALANADADADPASAAEAHADRAARHAAQGPPRPTAAPADADGQAAPDTPSGAPAPVEAEAVRLSEPPTDPADRHLPAPPRGRGEAARPQHHVAARLRPAHHHPGGGRRGRPAPALTTARTTDRPSLPGGTSCRNGLFSPSPCSPPAPSS
ncbi:hypothetical protein SUDANB54_00489 [Streptomyces sp. enrichment culture]